MSYDEEAVRGRLEAQRDELSQRLDRLRGSVQRETSHSGNVSGETDNAHEWENAEIAEGQIAEALDELRQTEAALGRLDEAAYGVCTVCGAPIAPERLELVPETVHCIRHA
jgi:RNA polymerase-binding transcription factor DksA